MFDIYMLYLRAQKGAGEESHASLLPPMFQIVSVMQTSMSEAWMLLFRGQPGTWGSEESHASLLPSVS